MTTVLLRSDIALNWMRVNPILAQGEFAFETDTMRAKIGDGIKSWNDLPYFYQGEITTPFYGVVENHNSVSIKGLKTKEPEKELKHLSRYDLINE